MATRCCSYELKGTLGAARTGVFHLPHGDVPTPAFMPVGTRGTVKGVTPRELRELGASMVLSNTYHLWVRPGHELIRRLGGLHTFMGWDGPILTDSGGFQVFSLREWTKVSEEGVTFRSPEDGEWRTLTPEVSIEVQEALGVDVAMAFDECIEFPATRDRVEASTERTTRWLRRCLEARHHPDRTAVLGIVQGGTYEDLRRAHARELVGMDLDGYAVGGLSVGEDFRDFLGMVDVSVAELPADKVRYLMGVGTPRDLVAAVTRGIDLFDCVVPTRAGRHATAFTSWGKINLRGGWLADDPRPLDPTVPHFASRDFSRAYLRHLLKSDELLGQRLATLHNLAYYQHLMARLRQAIATADEAAMVALEAEAERASTTVRRDPADAP